MLLFPAFSETIAGVADDLRERRRTCQEVVAGCLSRIDEWEPRVNAWVSVDREGALAQARVLDADLRAGRDYGPLHGISIGIKDLIDVAGWPTGCGSELMAGQIAPRDATLVARLRRAGAILIGKTMTTQFACFDPPPTRNPWNFECTPGGSSSGSAAAVATGMCLGAVGSQTGGSITRPASYCGVCGCKPTYGTVDVTGIFPVAQSLDHPGPIARCVGDLASLLSAMSPEIRLSVDTSHSTSPDRSPPRLARLGGLFDEKAEPAMRQVYDDALERFKARGATVADGALPNAFGDVLVMHRVVMLYELSQLHRDRLKAHPRDYQLGIRRIVEEGGNISRSTYDQALGRRTSLQREIAAAFGNADVLVCPATLGPAPDLSTTGDPSFNSPWSFTGLPTISFPIGANPQGLPLAMQLVGREHAESRLFDVALWCERTIRQQVRRL